MSSHAGHVYEIAQFKTLELPQEKLEDFLGAPGLPLLLPVPESADQIFPEDIAISKDPKWLALCGARSRLIELEGTAKLLHLAGRPASLTSKAGATLRQTVEVLKGRHRQIVEDAGPSPAGRNADLEDAATHLEKAISSIKKALDADKMAQLDRELRVLLVRLSGAFDEERRASISSSNDDVAQADHRAARRDEIYRDLNELRLKSRRRRSQSDDMIEATLDARGTGDWVLRRSLLARGAGDSVLNHFIRIDMYDVFAVIFDLSSIAPQRRGRPRSRSGSAPKPTGVPQFLIFAREFFNIIGSDVPAKTIRNALSGSN